VALAFDDGPGASAAAILSILESFLPHALTKRAGSRSRPVLMLRGRIGNRARDVCPFHPAAGMTEAASWCESEAGVTGHG